VSNGGDGKVKILAVGRLMEYVIETCLVDLQERRLPPIYIYLTTHIHRGDKILRSESEMSCLR
jgi:hypothetical protein